MEKKFNILVIDDDISFLYSMNELLLLYDFQVSVSSSGLHIEDLIPERQPDLILLDLKMPDTDGLQVLKRIMAYDAGIPVVMISGEGEIKHAVSAIKMGAFDFIEKGVEVETIIQTIKNALKKRKWLLESVEAIYKKNQDIDVIAESMPMKMVVEMGRKVAKKQVNALLTGQSGTGKEMIARLIHQTGNTPNGPFVAINCANLHENLLESELFGYKKGAFTGAERDKSGKIYEADNGTLFLDEIGELPLSLQARLLRVLEENLFTPLGDTRPVSVNFRLISATNRDLNLMIRDGHFRDDLYYRINTVTINIPPLNERREDIIPLVNYFLEILSVKHRKSPLKLHKSTEEILISYCWPGNVRELKNFLENLVVFCEADIVDHEQLFSILSGPLQHHPLSELIQSNRSSESII